MANYVNDLDFNPIINPYVPGATKEYADLQQRLVKDYDETAAHYDALQEAADNMVALTPDEEKKKLVMSKVNGVLSEAAQAGDYENRGRLVRKAIADFKKDYNPIAAQVTAYKEYEKYVNDRKDISERHKEEMLKEAMMRYKENNGYQQNPDGTISNGFSNYARKRAADFDEQKAILDLIKEKHAHEIETGKYKITGTSVIDVTTGREAITPQELRNLIADAREHNEAWKDYHNDLAYYKSAFTPNEVKETTKANIINSVNARIITPELLNSTVEELKKTRKKFTDINTEALNVLKEHGYVTKQDADQIKSQYNNIDADTLYKQHIYNNQLNEAQNFADDYAYTVTKDVEKFNQFLPDYKRKLELGAEQAANNSMTLAGLGSSSPVDAFKTSIESVNQAKQAASLQLTNYISDKKIQGNLLNINPSNTKLINEVNLILANEKLNDKEVETRLKSLGISTNNLTDARAVAAKMINSANNMAETQANIEFQKKLQEKTLKNSGVSIEKMYSEVMHKGVGTELFKDGMTLDKFKELVFSTEGDGTIMSLIKSLIPLRTAQQYLMKEVKAARGKIDEALKSSNNSVETNVYLTNEKEGSAVKVLNDNAQESLNHNLHNLDIAGSKTNIDTVLDSKGYSPEEIKSATIVKTALNTRPINGINSWRVTIKLGDGKDVKYETMDVNSVQGLNNNAIRDAKMETYANSMYKNNLSEKDNENRRDVKDNIAYSNAIDFIPNINQVRLMEAGEFSKGNEERIFKSSQGDTYKIIHSNGNFKVERLDNTIKNGRAVRDFVPLKNERGDNAVFITAEELITELGHYETNTYLSNNKR